MWTYLLGPLIALLPKRWQESVPGADYVVRSTAARLSGLLELVIGFVALLKWHTIAMAEWTGSAGVLAIFIWMTHPLTWFLGYTAVEGLIRFCCAIFAEQYLGSLPLFLLDKAFLLVSRKQDRANAARGLRENVTSYSGAVRDRLLEARLPDVPDELCFRTSASGEVLEVHSSRKKKDWNPPRVVNFEGSYYRLETSSLGAAPRPFCYTLRRLPKGVPSRSVLVYSPIDPIVREPADQAGVTIHS